MRIGVLTSLYPSPPRPYEGIFAERRWLGMAARGHEVQVVHPRPRTPGPLARGAWAEIRDMPAREERGGLVVLRPRYWHWPRRPAGNARRFARAGTAALLGDEPPEVVVCDYAWPAAAAVEPLARRGVPAVVSGRGSDVLQVAGEAGLAHELRTGLAASAGWCGVSRDLVDVLDALAGAPGRGFLVPNGVDTARYRPADRDAARARLGRRGDGAWVLVVGHLIERKDPLLAVEAFARARRPERLLLVGRGPLEDAVRERAARLGVADRVELLGERPPAELADWYAAADALLLTSWREGRPNVVLEALASGRPVLATPAGGTGELLAGLDGMLAASRDPGELARALDALLDRDHDPATLARHVAPLSWDASFGQLEACLVAARGGRGDAPSA